MSTREDALSLWAKTVDMYVTLVMTAVEVRSTFSSMLLVLQGFRMEPRTSYRIFGPFLIVQKWDGSVRLFCYMSIKYQQVTLPSSCMLTLSRNFGDQSRWCASSTMACQWFTLHYAPTRRAVCSHGRLQARYSCASVFGHGDHLVVASIHSQLVIWAQRLEGNLIVVGSSLCVHLGNSWLRLNVLPKS